jgi:hypothetical protein
VSQTSDPAAEERLLRHAELFRIGLPGWTPLEDRKPDAQGVIDYQQIVNRLYMFRDPPFTPAHELEEMAARADAVVSGTAEKRYSAANSLHTALYSDWIVRVTNVCKDGSAAGVQAGAGAQITVTRIGGDLMIKGHRVIYRDPGFPEFTIGHEYVFFLKAHPATLSFIGLSGGTFDVTGTSPVLLADPHNPTAARQFSSSSKAEFLEAVEKSAGARLRN